MQYLPQLLLLIHFLDSCTYDVQQQIATKTEMLIVIMLGIALMQKPK